MIDTIDMNNNPEVVLHAHRGASLTYTTSTVGARLKLLTLSGRFVAYVNPSDSPFDCNYTDTCYITVDSAGSGDKGTLVIDYSQFKNMPNLLDLENRIKALESI